MAAGRVRLPLLLHANVAAVSRGLSTCFPSPCTRADGRAFLAGEVIDLGGQASARVIGGQACVGISVSRGRGERRFGATGSASALGDRA